MGAVTGGNAWDGYRLVTAERERLQARHGVPLGGEAAARLDHWLGWASQELGSGHTGEARSSLVDARCVQLQAEAALMDTAAQMRRVPGVVGQALLGWSPHSAAYHVVDDTHGDSVVEIARPRAVSAEFPRWVLGADGHPLETPPPPSVLMSWGARLHQRLSGTTPIFPRFLATGEVGDRVYVLQERLIGRTLAGTLRERIAIDHDAFRQLALELLRLRSCGLLPYHHGVDCDRIVVDAQNAHLRLLPPMARGVARHRRPFRVVMLSNAPRGRGSDRFGLEACALRALRGSASVAFGRRPTGWEPKRWDLSPELLAHLPEVPEELPIRSLATTDLGEEQQAASLLCALGLALDGTTVRLGRRPLSLSGWDEVRGAAPYSPLFDAERWAGLSRQGPPPSPMGDDKRAEELSDEELAFAIRQDRDREQTVPEAIARLGVDVFRGALYEGELLNSLVTLPSAFLLRWPGLGASILTLVRRAISGGTALLDEEPPPLSTKAITELASAEGRLEALLFRQVLDGEPTLTVHIEGTEPWVISSLPPVTRVGRQPDCDILLRGPSGARMHCQLMTRRGGVQLAAFQPVVVSGETVRDAREVSPGDIIEAGDARILFSLCPVAAQNAPAVALLDDRWALGPRLEGTTRWGWDLVTDERVLIDVLHEDIGEHKRHAFQLAARRHAEADSEFVCQLVTVGDMNLLEGFRAVTRACYQVLRAPTERTLLQSVEETRMSLWEAADWGVRLCEALQLAHDRGVCHGNLQLGSVLTSSYASTFAVFGFGAAPLLLPEDPEMSLWGACLAHLYPDVLEGKPDSVRADIWSLGCLLYEGISGEPPFAPVAGDPAAGDAFDAVRRAVATKPASLAMYPGVSPEFASVIHRCFAPSGGYVDMVELLDALAPFAEDTVEDVVARMRGRTRRTAVVDLERGGPDAGASDALEPVALGFRVVEPLPGDGRTRRFTAYQPTLGQSAILEVAHEGLGRADHEQMLASWRRLARVCSPLLPQLWGAGQLDDGRPYLLRESFSDETLFEAAPLGYQATLGLALVLLDGLERLVAAGLAPAWLAPGDVEVAAVGEARRFMLVNMDHALRRRPDNEPVGSFVYAPPEVFHDGGPQNPEQRVQYIIGALCFFAWTGRRLVEVDGAMGMLQYVNAGPSPVASIAESPPTEPLRSLLERLLQRQASERFGDLRDLRWVLGEALEAAKRGHL